MSLPGLIKENAEKLTKTTGMECEKTIESHFSSAHSVVFNSATPWTVAYQASLSITNSQSLLKLMSMELVMPSNHLILCHPLLLLPSIFRSIRVFPNESVFIESKRTKMWSIPLVASLRAISPKPWKWKSFLKTLSKPPLLLLAPALAPGNYADMIGTLHTPSELRLVFTLIVSVFYPTPKYDEVSKTNLS